MKMNGAGFASLCALLAAGRVAGAQECGSIKQCAVECRDGKAGSCDVAGKMFFHGKGVETDVGMAQKLFAIGCNAGAANACSNLGMMYREGYASSRDEARGAELFEMGCFGGSARGCFFLGEFCEKRGTDGDAHRAELAFERACNSGDSRQPEDRQARDEGCVRLAKLVASTSPARAAAIYQTSCNRRVAEACVGLADLYASGDGVEQDDAKAQSLRNAACKLGDVDACMALASAYEEDDQYSRAASIYNRLCGDGNGAACYQLGLLYSDGLGVPEDAKRAAKAMSRACDLGNSDGCNMASDQ
jgi:TPR repeat protein